MVSYRVFLSSLLWAALLSIASAGSSSDCKVVGLRVAPPSATVEHTAAAPANSQIFNASYRLGGGNGPCPANTAMMVNANWTASDPSVRLSAKQGMQVTATCTAALAKPVTITATSASGQKFTGQATLVCK